MTQQLNFKFHLINSNLYITFLYYILKNIVALNHDYLNTAKEDFCNIPSSSSISLPKVPPITHLFNICLLFQLSTHTYFNNISDFRKVKTRMKKAY